MSMWLQFFRRGEGGGSYREEVTVAIVVVDVNAELPVVVRVMVVAVMVVEEVVVEETGGTGAK